MLALGRGDFFPTPFSACKFYLYQLLTHIFRMSGLAACYLKVAPDPYSCLGSVSPLFSGLKVKIQAQKLIFNADADCNLLF